MNACVLVKTGGQVKVLSGVAWPPITPRHPPMLPRRQCLRHRIKPAGAARSATRDAKQRHPAAGPQTMAGDGLVTELGTGRDMPAAISDEAGKRELIQPDQAHAEQTVGGLAEGTAPVASGGRRRGFRMSTIRRAAHAGQPTATLACVFASIWSIASTTASKVSIVEAWRAL